MKTKEEILKRNVEAIAKCSVKYNVTHQGILNAMEEYANKCQQDMQKDVEYWQGEFDHWHQQAMQMADKKYTEEDLHTILRLRKEWYSHTDKNVVRDFINSLNKKD